MAKIDLKRSSGIPISYNGADLQPQGLKFKNVLTVNIDEIRPQLLNKDLSCPEIFYRKWEDLDGENVFSEKNLILNFYTVQPNLAGIEYVKTKASKSIGFPVLLETVYGGGMVLMQKYKSSSENRIIKKIIKKGEKAIVPSGYSYTIVNTRQNSNLVVAEITSRLNKTKFVLDDTNGMAYYVIRKNAKQEIVRNPYYKIVNNIEKINWEEIFQQKGITPKTPIIRQILRNYEKFDWLFEKDIAVF